MAYYVDRTERNRQVLALLLQGCTQKEIAARLYLSLATAKRSMTEIYRAHGVSRKKELIAKYKGEITE